MIENDILKWKEYAYSKEHFNSFRNFIPFLEKGISDSFQPYWLRLKRDLHLVIYTESEKNSHGRLHPCHNDLSYLIVLTCVKEHLELCESKKFNALNSRINAHNLLTSALKDIKEFFELFEYLEKYGYVFKKEIQKFRRGIEGVLQFDISVRMPSNPIRDDKREILYDISPVPFIFLSKPIYHSSKDLIDDILDTERLLVQFNQLDELGYLTGMNPILKDYYIQNRDKFDWIEIPNS